MDFQKVLFAPEKVGENRLPARTLLIPAGMRGVTHRNYLQSDRVQLLSGDWRFSYLPEDTEEAFYLSAYNDRAWDTLEVPSMWQFHGYGTCYYPNVRYVFPYDPPYIHRNNPVGLYRLSFRAKKPEQGCAVLRFLGVDNVYFVWLNGTYIGFSKGSRIPAEFDVTAALSDGDNLLAVKVYTYSDASYLENQDMLLASGIFRDVMLIYTGENALWDYTLLPDKTGLTVKYLCSVGRTPAVLRFTLCDAAGAVCAAAEKPLTESGEAFLPLANAVEWNAEQPYLYTLYTEIAENGRVTETHTKKVGIAQSSIDGYYLKMNGKPITLKGVNRHENNCRTGRAIKASQIEAELKDIKACGLNAIRCSHYTNQPLFYELCSELGIYVMDEADCESHGAEASGDQGALNKDPAWFDAFFDRASRMYALNKNETCINIWSLGNECGAGENNTRTADWLTRQDVKKPIKDMSACFPDAEEQFALTGYMPMQTLYDTEENPAHPLLMVEYGHAMGNSPGGLEDIWNWVYENEHCCGGYVWEYKSHGFFTKGKNSRPRYLYGGDFPDEYHWSNFSLDGYHRSDGTPKPAWAELREVSAPVHVRWEENGVTVKNTYDFLPLDGVILRWSVCADGKAVRQGEIPLDGLPARERRFFSLPLETQGLSGLITADCVFSKAGRILAHKQTVLADIPLPAPEPEAFRHSVSQKADVVCVTGENFCVTVKNGLLCRLEKNSKVLLQAPMQLNCMRAPTDNDGIVGFDPRLAGVWKDYLVHTMRFGCHSVCVDDTPAGVTVTATGKFLPQSYGWGFDTVLCYRIASGGGVQVEISMKPYYKDDKPAVLPRVGVYFELDPVFAHCRWFGRGPDENYPDCKAHTPIGAYEADISDLHFLYDVPQETGNHGDCRRVTVSGGGKALTVLGAFSFSFHDFSPAELIKARHCDELEKSEKHYLYIDHRHRGLGSNSCGPQPEKAYELPTGDYQWSFRLEPDA